MKFLVKKKGDSLREATKGSYAKEQSDEEDRAVAGAFDEQSEEKEGAKNMRILALPEGKGLFKSKESYLIQEFTHKEFFEFFDIEQIALSGQCFSIDVHEKNNEGKTVYKITTKDKMLLLCQTYANSKNSFSCVELCCEPDSLNMWLHYLDIVTEDGQEVTLYQELAQEILASGDEVLKEARQGVSGIRILNQDLLETGISFITSANNNIPRITGLMKRLKERYGEAKEFCGIKYNAFPALTVLTRLKESDFREMGFGFRAPYLVDFIRWYDIHSGTNIEVTKESLMEIKGVGEKIADCILLYSQHDLERVPMDVWMKRVKQNLYKGQEFPWTKYRGVCQQYVYCYYRV